MLLRKFARPNNDWADKADYIEFLYTDEVEHREDIDELWEMRRKRMGTKKLRQLVAVKEVSFRLLLAQTLVYLQSSLLT